MNRMLNFALHELAHAYHDRVAVAGVWQSGGQGGLPVLGSLRKRLSSPLECPRRPAINSLLALADVALTC